MRRLGADPCRVACGLSQNPEPEVVADVKAEVNEAYRVLRPGGMFVYM